MKKLLALTSAIYLMTGVAAYAEIIIQPTISLGAPAPVVVEQEPVYAPAYIVEHPYPQHFDRNHHHYDWKYWHDHHEHEEHDHHDEHYYDHH